MEGFDVIKELRANGIQTPVMIVSGRNEDYDSLYGLSIGADDYITKPFRPLVLGAKVKALIRRTKIWEITQISSSAGRSVTKVLLCVSIKMGKS